MTRSELHFTMLSRLACVISNIDSAKLRHRHLLHELAEAAKAIVDNLKMELMDIGNLHLYVDAIHAAIADRPNALPTFISAAHYEIERLLGCRAAEVYSNEETA